MLQGQRRLQALLRRTGVAAHDQAGAAYAGRDFTDVRTHGDRLDQPIRWAKRRMIFVNSMSDLFHPAVPDDFIDSVFGVMWACLYGRNEQDGHIFQVLTKRADRMHDYFRKDRREAWARSAVQHGGGIDPDGIWDQTMNHDGPHPRIWLGVSVEDQAAADERIPLLLQTPAAVRWISAEPLLGPVDLSYWLDIYQYEDGDIWRPRNLSRPLNSLDWIVVGGESGPKARPMHPQWARDLRDQCAAAGVPFMLKQHGEWLSSVDATFLGNENSPLHKFEDGTYVVRVGKKAAGRLLDGVTHDGYPGQKESAQK